MTRLFLKFLRDERGTTAIEYCVLAALIGMVLITAVTTMGAKLNSGFASVASKLP
jgi:pilus assembly protein Flp/PilA